jgi:hypothetical protein
MGITKEVHHHPWLDLDHNPVLGDPTIIPISLDFQESFLLVQQQYLIIRKWCRRCSRFVEAAAAAAVTVLILT